MDKLQKVRFSGKSLTSPFGKTKCVYFELAFFYEDGSYTGVYHSQDLFHVSVENEKLDLGVPPARLYLKPTFEKEFETSKTTGKIKEIFLNIFKDEMPKKITVKEWALLPGQEYFFSKYSETFYLPPQPGTDEPTERSSTSYYISDLDYSAEKKQDMKTPSSCWTY